MASPPNTCLGPGQPGLSSLQPLGEAASRAFTQLGTPSFLPANPHPLKAPWGNHRGWNQSAQAPHPHGAYVWLLSHLWVPVNPQLPHHGIHLAPSQLPEWSVMHPHFSVS